MVFYPVSNACGESVHVEKASIVYFRCLVMNFSSLYFAFQIVNLFHLIRAESSWCFFSKIVYLSTIVNF